ncbi:MAG: acetamidase/formamidase family protein [Desulfitobacteriaceae bacterium]
MGENVTQWGNPMTGPFYVEGAVPGETLEIRIESMIPNRDWGWSSNVLAPNVVESGAIALLPSADIVRWHVDHQQGLARLEQPTVGLQTLNLAVRPFLGCFGVAPSRGQAISTATSGEYGGNMDYKGFVAGVVVYLPIFAEGALFHLGDGHALQGDGEIAGTGVEISLDVRFSVRVRKEQAIRWPRGESDTHLFCIGNARPLESALQVATTEMLFWLREDYGLTVNEVSLLLGQSAEYEVANVYNPAYTMVCKVSKSSLPAPKLLHS